MKYVVSVLFLLCGSLIGHSAIAGWLYFEDADPMTSKTTSRAVMESNNSIDLEFPYKGKNFGNFTVRKRHQRGMEVIFNIDKGQLICPPGSDCSISIRFDGRPPMSFGGSGSADYNPTVMFLNNPSKFIAEASKSKRILVQANIYMNGLQLFEFFTAEPLIWKPRK